jgi:hypothetical protein
MYTDTAVSNGPGTLTVNFPSTVVEGRLALLFFGNDGNDVSGISEPAGWTLLDDTAGGSTSSTGQKVFSKTVVAGDASAAVQITLSNTAAFDRCAMTLAIPEVENAAILQQNFSAHFQTAGSSRNNKFSPDSDCVYLSWMYFNGGGVTGGATWTTEATANPTSRQSRLQSRTMAADEPVSNVLNYGTAGYTTLADIAVWTPITKTIWPKPSYLGSPYKKASAVTMNAIKASRTSCVGLPAIIQCSASNVEAVGIDRPYEDGEFSWEVTSGAETEHTFLLPGLVRTVDGVEQSTTKDLHTDQYGPEALFRFYQPGTKTITLTARFPDGAGGYITDTQTVDFVVTDLTNHYWFDPDAGDNANDGRDPHGLDLSGATFTTATKTLTSVGAFASYDHAAATAPEYVSRYNYIYISGGTGVTPGLYEIASKTSDDAIVLVADIGGTNPSDVSSSDGPKATASSMSTASNTSYHLKGGNTANHSFPSDPRGHPNVRIVNYGLENAKSASQFWIITPGGFFEDGRNTCLHGIDINRTASKAIYIIAQHPTNSPLDHLYFSKGTYTTSGDNPVGDNGLAIDLQPEYSSYCGFIGVSIINYGVGQKVAIFSNLQDFFSVVGGTFEGEGDNNTLDHHIYPSTKKHKYFTWINFGSGVGRNFCINTNYNNPDGTPGLPNGKYVSITENIMTGTLRAWDSGHGTPGYYGEQEDFVVQGNAVHELGGDSTIIFDNSASMTVRDNAFWGMTEGVLFTTSNSPADMRFYQNVIYRNEGNTSAVLRFASSLLSGMLKDNTIVDTKASGLILDLKAGTVVDGNQIYVPSISGDYVKIGSTITWSAYEALDHNARITDPGWTDPASGDFSTSGTPDNFYPGYISGAARVGETLTAHEGIWNDQGNGVGVSTWQWYSYTSPDGSDETLIGTGATYEVTSSDVGLWLAAKEVRTNDGGTNASQAAYTDYLFVSSGSGELVRSVARPVASSVASGVAG